MKRISLISRSLAIFGGILLTAQTSRAITIGYHVDISTSGLVGNAAGPFSLDFQLNDGLGTGDGNNTALINHFSFGSGSASGSPSSFGGASGSLLSSVALVDTSAFNEFYQAFIAGNSLSFDLFLTMNIESVPTPDLFSFGILDRDLANIPTHLFGDSLLQISLGNNPSINISSSSAKSSPDVTLNVTQLPDTGSSAALFLIALVFLGGVGRTFQRTANQHG